ncbi:MAG: Stk1 family PASTA domain-containing Ser/Thr kinase [Lachnospiraceae bacterium]|nr:Stk1 family PASTA domain-containing Ser/Thr kinase [Lachnospiraceae bacterium]
MLKPGMILCDRYEILDVVGAGGMSIVYKARCHRLNRNVAIKVLKPEFSNDKNFVTKFRIEAQASAGLTHPNIVNVYDVYDDDGIYFIVMELIEGITLKEYIQENGRLPMDKAIDFSIQIASGLEAAHENHIIHRDIKPQNIIVSKNGILKVTDFGIAKAATSNTLTSGAMGSVHYISPEQARGGYSDERSDIYSLGITMYEMVTGRVPFEGDNNVAVALMHIQNDIIPPRQYYPDIYSSIEKIILKATQKKPERRYLTASALIADLKRVQNNPNIDIVVAPTSITNSPTQEWTKEDVKAIRDQSNSKDVYDEFYGNQYANSQLNAFNTNQPFQNEMGELRQNPSSQIQVNNGKINQLLEEEEWEDDYEEEYEPQPKRGNLKKVQDYDEDYDDDDDDDDDDEIDPSLKKAVTIAGAVAAIIVFLIIVIIFGKIMGWFKIGGNGIGSTKASTTEMAVEEDGVMPDVVNLSEDAAISELKKAGFENVKVTHETNQEATEGYVFYQSFRKGEVVKLANEIEIKVSAGAEEIDVPDVTGLEDDQACTILMEAGFEIGHAFEFDEEVEKDKVIKQSPEGNTKAKAGTKVIITISNGSEKKKVQVPDIHNVTEEQARRFLEDKKLVAGNVTHEKHDTVPKGMVISQSIPAMNEVDEGTTIDFVISDGPEEKKKVYTANITGTISCIDESVEGSAVTVQVCYNGDVVYSMDITVTVGTAYSVSASVPELEEQGGSADFIIVDAAGNDITSFFNKGAINISYVEEEQ